MSDTMYLGSSGSDLKTTFISILFSVFSIFNISSCILND
jgi:hypothetical protein